MSDANTELLMRMAEALGDLREQMAFVGGCATALLVSDPAAAPVRATQDVDAIITVESGRVGNTVAWEKRWPGGGSRSRSRKPSRRTGSLGATKLDLMPTDERVLGFSNRW